MWRKKVFLAALINNTGDIFVVSAPYVFLMEIKESKKKKKKGRMGKTFLVYFCRIGRRLESFFWVKWYGISYLTHSIAHSGINGMEFE